MGFCHITHRAGRAIIQLFGEPVMPGVIKKEAASSHHHALDQSAHEEAVSDRFQSNATQNAFHRNGVNRIIEFLAETTRLISLFDIQQIDRARTMLLECYRRKGRIYTAGNGGSASTAQHFACDLSKYVIPDGQRPYDTRCLTDNVALYTAWANDAERQDVYVNMLRGLLTEADLLLVISVHGGTGFSADLVRALRYSRRIGAPSIALVGFDGGVLHQEATCSILVPVQSTPQTEALHLVIEHLLMQLLREDLAKEAGGGG